MHVIQFFDPRCKNINASTFFFVKVRRILLHQNHYNLYCISKQTEIKMISYEDSALKKIQKIDYQVQKSLNFYMEDFLKLYYIKYLEQIVQAFSEITLLSSYYTIFYSQNNMTYIYTYHHFESTNVKERRKWKSVIFI